MAEKIIKKRIDDVYKKCDPDKLDHVRNRCSDIEFKNKKQGGSRAHSPGKNQALICWQTLFDILEQGKLATVKKKMLGIKYQYCPTIGRTPTLAELQLGNSSQLMIKKVMHPQSQSIRGFIADSIYQTGKSIMLLGIKNRRTGKWLSATPGTNLIVLYYFFGIV